ncbi:hypothetical protein [Rhizobium binxianense]|uniref:hypothetical protein n=1 Tax=Rhizobium binxianense TaxID=3024242 RepID=UPI00234F2FE8|nr:hypothetical protein [Rhizobium sp. BC56]MDC7742479.1 hypothetical protein [Rhizobium sp. BC56]
MIIQYRLVGEKDLIEVIRMSQLSFLFAEPDASTLYTLDREDVEEGLLFDYDQLLSHLI